MQFKPQGRRVQVLAYAGYDKDKKRAIVKMLGSYDSYNLEPSDGLINNLTDEQKTELQSHFEEVRQSREKESLQLSAKYTASGLRRVAQALESGAFEPTQEWVDEVVASVKVLAPLDCKVPVLLMVSALMLLAPPAAVAKVRVPLLLRVLASCIVLPSAPPCKVPALVRPVAWIFKPLPNAFAPAWLSKEAVPVLLKLSVPPACKYALILLMTATLLPVA